MMLDESIPAKTAAGRLEVEKRAMRLGARQRAVLIAINGERKLGDVRRQFLAYGDVDALFDELVEAGLIEYTGTPAAADLRKDPPAEVPPPAAVSASAPPPTPPTPETSGPLQEARKYINDTVAEHLGLRAFMFTLKIEKCYSRRELLDLLPEFRRQLRKVITNAEVNACHEQAEALIARI